MNLYFRILRWVRPYLLPVTVSIVITVVYSLLSGASIVMIQPFLRTLFYPTEAAAPATEPPSGALSAPGGLRPPPAVDREAVKWRTRASNFLLRGSRSEALWRIVWVFFLLFFAKNVALYIGSVLTTWVGQRIVKDLRDAVFDRFTRLPMTFYHRHRAGELISRATNDVLIAQKCVNVSFTNLIRDPALIVIFLAVCFSIDWRLTLIALLVLPLSSGVIARVGRRLRRYSHRQQEELASLTSVLQETVYGIRVVKAFAMETFERRRFLRESDRLFRSIWKITVTQRVSGPLSEQLSVSVGLFILWLGGHRVLTDGDLSPDQFILFLACVFSIVHPIKELGSVHNAIQEGMAAAERIFSILDEPPEAPEDDPRPDLGAVRGRVEFREVSFSYRPGTPVLRGINLVVEPGEVVALVGTSGAGKSTLVDLIPRFYDPDTGTILVDGKDVRMVSLRSLRRAMGIVTQEVILFNDTVRSNIAYGLDDVDPAAVEAAARAANAHDFITQLPDGYDTLIGDRGTKLSGGQRQRLSIARAILKSPPILILDEATSALDTENERLVQEAIDRLIRNRTTIVIAHRLSTIRSVDRICTMKDGLIVESGSHQELLAIGGAYAELYNLQFREDRT